MTIKVAGVITGIAPSTTIPTKNHFKGGNLSIQRQVNKLRENGEDYTKTNDKDGPVLKEIALSDLVHFENNREAKPTWAVDMLAQREFSLDMFAFGTLMVCESWDEPGKYKVVDGNGRWLIATLFCRTNKVDTANMKIPCTVWPMTKLQAAYYFMYNQSKGRRSLSKESIFVAGHGGGEKDFIHLATILDYVGLYISGDSLQTVPEKKKINTSEIKFRTIDEAYRKIANGDKDICRLAKEIIHNAWKNDKSYSTNPKINQDLFWALVSALKKHTILQSGTPLIELNRFICANATITSQTVFAKEWKQAGKGGQVQLHHLLRFELLRRFKSSNQCSSGTSSAISNIDPTK